MIWLPSYLGFMLCGCDTTAGHHFHISHFVDWMGERLGKTAQGKLEERDQPVYGVDGVFAYSISR